jgi:D-tyrosyl-tRNA(Tyr) deacylase
MVLVDKKVTGSIHEGLVVLVGFTHDDDINDIDYIVKKIINLRIFDDAHGVMNLSIKDTSNNILSISQFTLYADTKKGNRPSYTNAMKSCYASKLYDIFNQRLKDNGINVQTGIFGADMDVHIRNDGPVTIIIDSKVR